MLSKTVLMHCVSLYPTPLKKINLNFIQTLKKSSSFPLDFQIIQLEQRQWRSPSMGVNYIEKHFTLDKSRNGFDHKISLEPFEFSLMVKKLKELIAY